MFTIKRKRKTSDSSAPSGPALPESGKLKKILLTLLLFALICSNVFLFNRLISSRKTIIKQQQVLINVQEPPDASSEVSGKWYGLCQKNSIHSIQDFIATVENDPLLSQHFSDFDWRNARMGKLEAAIWTHVAYRKNGKIATTRRAIRLPKGDGFITDGKRWLRTYCCNDYVLAALPGKTHKDAVAGTEPEEGNPDAELDQYAKAAGPAAWLNEMVDDADRLPTDETTITAVPEPASLVLFWTGMSGFGLARLIRRRPHHTV